MEIENSIPKREKAEEVEEDIRTVHGQTAMQRAVAGRLVRGSSCWRQRRVAAVDAGSLCGPPGRLGTAVWLHPPRHSSPGGHAVLKCEIFHFARITFQDIYNHNKVNSSPDTGRQYALGSQYG